MNVIYIYVLFYRYANHTFVSHFARNSRGDECELPLTILTPSILGKSFSFGEERIGPTCCMTSHIHIA
jgi:hypothetical protein